MLILPYVFSQKNSSKDKVYWWWNIMFPLSENNILTFHLGQFFIKRFIRFYIWYRNIAHKDKTTPIYTNEYWKSKLNANENILKFFFVKNLGFYFKSVQTNSWITTFAINKPHLICLWKADVCWKPSSYWSS